MGRIYIGDFKFTGLLEAGIAGPIDARYVVDYYADLISADTWPAGTDVYIYEGMQVYVKEYKKVYILTDAANYQSESSWKELASDVESTQIEIVDNLNSEDPSAALSANMGRQLKDNLEAFKDNLLVDDKIRPEYLPQFNTGLLYGGTIDSKRICVLTKTLKDKLGLQETVGTRRLEELSVEACENVYFIAKEYGIYESLPNTNSLTVPERSAGDWIISNGKQWEKIESNAVTSVVGKTGAITREQLLDALAYDEDKDAENTAEGGFIRKNEINRLDARIEGLVETTSNTGTKVVNIEKTLTWKTL